MAHNKKKVLKITLLSLPIIAVLIALIVSPSVYIDSFYNGLLIFCISVLPAMFPFFFFTKLLTAFGFADAAATLTAKPVKYLYNAPSIGGYVLFMSLISGYPIGAKLIADFYETNRINASQAKKTLAFTSTSGPLFILGTIGVAAFENYTAGVVILISHITATLLNGFIYRGKYSATADYIPKLPPTDYDKALSESVYSAVISILIVGAYIALFNMVGDMLTDIGILPLFAKGLSYIMPNAYAEVCNGLSFGLIEMTRGCIILSKTALPLTVNIPCATFIITLGGAGITIQSMTFLSKCKVNPFYYLLTKLTQSILALGISIGLSAWLL